MCHCMQESKLREINTETIKFYNLLQVKITMYGTKTSGFLIYMFSPIKPQLKFCKLPRFKSKINKI